VFWVSKKGRKHAKERQPCTNTAFLLLYHWQRFGAFFRFIFFITVIQNNGLNTHK